MSLSPDHPAPISQLICTQCGAQFECKPAGGCWCADETFRLPMPPPGEACLCPACLRALAAGSREPVSL